MSLFGKKKQSPLVALPGNLRPDLRDIIEKAPPGAATSMRRAEASAALREMNLRLPEHEQVTCMTHFVKISVPDNSYGYLAMSSSTIYVTTCKVGLDTQVLAIKVTDVSRFTFDSGMAFLYFGSPEQRLDFAFPGAIEQSYSRTVCDQIQAACKKPHPYQI